MKIDLHLHSKYSKRPSQWVLQKLGCPESFTDPVTLHRLTRKKGMSALTITDHNTIEGCLEIAHLPNTFISEEVTTYFPEDGCKVHVLVYDIDEAIHEDIRKIRKNIYDLTAYLIENKIIHALAHPLFSVNDRLTLDHFEKFLLLFKTMELNGARNDFQNQVLRSVVDNLSRGDIELLTDKHGIVPREAFMWQKSMIGGSDDHSALNIARMFTYVPEARTTRDFLRAIGTVRCRPMGGGSSPITLSHNLYGIAYQFFNNKFNLHRYANQDVLMRFLERILQPEPRSEGWIPIKFKEMLVHRKRRNLASSDRIQDVLRHEGVKAISNDPELNAIVSSRMTSHENPDEDWFRFVDVVSNKVIQRFGHNLFDHLSGANVFNIFGSIGAAGSLYSVLAPYFVSFGLFARDRELVHNVQSRFAEKKFKTVKRDIKVAHFTDTFYEVNGVAGTLRQQAELAGKLGKDLTIITCARNKPEKAGRVYNFAPIDVFELPEYPEQKLFLPPFLKILRHVYDEEYTYVHTATPGPIGLVALAVARILDLPISGTYHTALPQYAARLTGDQTIEQLVWRYTLWFYDQMRIIYVPSRDTGDELVEKGINPDKIRLYPRGVDVHGFRPSLRNGFYHNLGIEDQQIKLLYVGRVSKEKDLPTLVEAFKQVVDIREGVQLIVVGDGPYLDEMKSELSGLPCIFTGYLQGMDLAQAYASADIFVFPSTTDTFGNVILEAQASGLPVIVSDAGGPRENILPGETGIVTRGGDKEQLVDAICTLLDDPEKRARMGKAARNYTEKRSFENAFLEHWKLYRREQAETSTVNKPERN